MCALFFTNVYSETGASAAPKENLLVLFKIYFTIGSKETDLRMTSLYRDFPVVIKNRIKDWNILKYTTDDWCNEFKDSLLKFRQGVKTFSESPYWEDSCESKYLTLRSFFELSSQKQDYWLYFDYKYMKDVFPENQKLLEEIKWADVELPNLDGQDSTLWIGNEGSHTPCHIDTYGCNFVAQIFGRKLWILIPPEETKSLEPIRVPYEESSIYSALNFYTPTDKLLKIKHAFKIILAPGDVLYVPQHWWHYVENLEVSISVNVWVPLETDHESRLEECLVQHYISWICKELTEAEAKQLLNPNEYNLLAEPCTLNMIQKCIENCRTFRLNSDEVKQLFKVKPDFMGNQIGVSQFDIMSYINEKSKTHSYCPSSKRDTQSNSSDRVTLAKALINSHCHPSNISLLKNSLLNQFDSSLRNRETT